MNKINNVAFTITITSAGNTDNLAADDTAPEASRHGANGAQTQSFCDTTTSAMTRQNLINADGSLSNHL